MILIDIPAVSVYSWMLNLSGRRVMFYKAVLYTGQFTELVKGLSKALVLDSTRERL